MIKSNTHWIQIIMYSIKFHLTAMSATMSLVVGISRDAHIVIYFHFHIVVTFNFDLKQLLFNKIHYYTPIHQSEGYIVITLSVNPLCFFMLDFSASIGGMTRYSLNCFNSHDDLYCVSYFQGLPIDLVIF